MRAWLCMKPVRLQVAGRPTATPPEALALLAVYKTKKLAREVHGPDAPLVPVEWPCKQVK